ncbi:MAG: SDR family NAD(P)-dependent oxidoreductase [Alsobacter sp.]
MPTMIDAAARLADVWIGRRAVADAGAVGAFAGRRPAVVVTGGSSGIGLAIATTFADAGEPVLLVARDAGRLERARAGLAVTPERAARVAILSLDVTVADAGARIDAAVGALGWYVDVLVNAAGVGLAGPLASQSQEDLDCLIGLNVAALTRLTRHALPGMLARARGGVINVSSLGGYVPGPHQAVYYASKAYVCSLSAALAEEIAGRGVRMTVVAPGPVETDFHAKMGADGALYRRILPSMAPEQVGRAAVAGFKLGRRVVVPGVMPSVAAVLVSVLPNWVTVPIVGRLLRAPRFWS